MPSITPSYLYAPFVNGFKQQLRTARGVGQTLYNSLPIVASWVSQAAFEVTSSGASAIALSPASGANTNWPGFTGGGATTTAGSAVFLTPNGTLTFLASGGTVTTSAYSGQSGTVFTGITSTGHAWLVDGSGKVYANTPSGGTVIAGAFPSGTIPALQPGIGTLAGSATLYTLLGGTSGVGAFNLTSLASSFIATPIPNPEALTASSGLGLLAVGGWQGAQMTSGFNSMAFNPAALNTLATVVSAISGVQIWTQDGSARFTQANTLTSAAAFQAAYWSNNGLWLFVPQAPNGIVICSYNFATLSASAKIPTSGLVRSIAITTNSVLGLATQPDNNQVTSLTLSGSLWVSGVAATLNKAQTALTISSNSIMIGFGSGLTLLTYTGSAWVSGATTALPAAPSYLAADSFGNAVAAWTSAGVTTLYSSSNGLSGSYSGGCSGLFVERQQYVALDPVNGVFQVFASIASASALVSKSTFGSGIGAGSNALAIGSGLVLASNLPGNFTTLYQFLSPYTLTQIPSGQVSIYNGSTWATANLGTAYRPTAIVFSGASAVVAVSGNALFTITSGGAVASSAQLNQQPGQLQNVPIGTSSLQIATGLTKNLVGTSSMNEAFLVIE